MNDENIETPAAPKKSRAKKTEEPKAAPAPKRENPVPGAPEIDGKFPSDEGYNYGAALEMLLEAHQELKAEMEKLEDVRRGLVNLRPTVSAPSSDVVWRSQQAIQRRIQAEKDERKTKVAAVLKEMNLL